MNPVNPFVIETLGEAKYTNQLPANGYISDSKVLLYNPKIETTQSNQTISIDPSQTFAHLQIAGPRKNLYFNPSDTIAGVVVCGGLCPGINNVVRALVQCLHYRYSVQLVYAFKYGFEGIAKADENPPDHLTVGDVRDIHKFGGSYVGTSRGPQDTAKMVDNLEKLKVNILFTIGGDGTLKGAMAISAEAVKRNLKLSVIGIPKTVDNDVLYVEKTFGFETAVEMAQAPIQAAHEEARSHRNGIGIVKLMGRDSGFIALNASIASADVNCLLIPEKKFKLEKLVDVIEQRFKNRNHFLIVIAEGAAQDICNTGPLQKDASGNTKFTDSGVWLQENLARVLKERKIIHTIKYIDPSYTIRTAPTNSHDSIFTVILAQMAVHAAMAGKTCMVVGLIQNQFVHIPISKAVEKRKVVELNGTLYQTFLDNSGMPDLE